ncbi:hypothetical protein CTA2_2470, partial [Colletotrichum tanaceti]
MIYRNRLTLLFFVFFFFACLASAAEAPFEATELPPSKYRGEGDSSNSGTSECRPGDLDCVDDRIAVNNRDNIDGDACPPDDQDCAPLGDADYRSDSENPEKIDSDNSNEDNSNNPDETDTPSRTTPYSADNTTPARRKKIPHVQFATYDWYHFTLKVTPPLDLPPGPKPSPFLWASADEGLFEAYAFHNSDKGVLLAVTVNPLHNHFPDDRGHTNGVQFDVQVRFGVPLNWPFEPPRGLQLPPPRSPSSDQGRDEPSDQERDESSDQERDESSDQELDESSDQGRDEPSDQERDESSDQELDESSDPERSPSRSPSGGLLRSLSLSGGLSRSWSLDSSRPWSSSGLLVTMEPPFVSDKKGVAFGRIKPEVFESYMAQSVPDKQGNYTVGISYKRRRKAEVV